MPLSMPILLEPRIWSSVFGHFRSAITHLAGYFCPWHSFWIFDRTHFHRTHLYKFCIFNWDLYMPGVELFQNWLCLWCMIIRYILAKLYLGCSRFFWLLVLIYGTVLLQVNMSTVVGSMSFGFPWYRQQCIIWYHSCIHVIMLFVFCDYWLYIVGNKLTTTIYRDFVSNWTGA